MSKARSLYTFQEMKYFPTGRHQEPMFEADRWSGLYCIGVGGFTAAEVRYIKWHHWSKRLWYVPSFILLAIIVAPVLAITGLGLLMVAIGAAVVSLLLFASLGVSFKMLRKRSYSARLYQFWLRLSERHQVISLEQFKRSLEITELGTLTNEECLKLMQQLAKCLNKALKNRKHRECILESLQAIESLDAGSGDELTQGEVLLGMVDACEDQYGSSDLRRKIFAKAGN